MNKIVRYKTKEELDAYDLRALFTDHAILEGYETFGTFVVTNVLFGAALKGKLYDDRWANISSSAVEDIP